MRHAARAPVDATRVANGAPNAGKGGRLQEHDEQGERDRMLRLVSSLDKPSAKALTIFLGAGASKPFGYPITRELMLNIFRYVSRRAKNSRSHRKLHKFLSRLLPGERASLDSMPMVTGVLSLLDHSLATGQVLLPKSSLEETRLMRSELEKELLRSIPDDQAFDPKERQLFDRHCDWLGRLFRYRRKGRMGIVTSNYDMLSDLLACYVTKVKGGIGDWRYEDIARKIDFGFRWNNPYKNTSFVRPNDPKFSLYKLHGSTNWLRCPLCENLYVNPDGQISMLAGGNFSWAGNVCHCSDTLLVPQIVSPSFLRSVTDPNLIAIWRNALDLLRESDHWLIIGYGFPDEDVAIRALFTRAFTSRDYPPKVSVVQRGQDALANYLSFFPNDNFQYYTGGIELLLKCAVH